VSSEQIAVSSHSHCVTQIITTAIDCYLVSCQPSHMHNYV